MERFKNDDPGYRRWVNSNYGGYILHRKPGDFSLHSVGCPHVHPEPGDDGRYTKAEKICSMDREELIRFARREANKEPITCDDC